MRRNNAQPATHTTGISYHQIYLHCVTTTLNIHYGRPNYRSILQVYKMPGSTIGFQSPWVDCVATTFNVLYGNNGSSVGLVSMWQVMQTTCNLLVNVFTYWVTDVHHTYYTPGGLMRNLLIDLYKCIKSVTYGLTYCSNMNSTLDRKLYISHL